MTRREMTKKELIIAGELLDITSNLEIAGRALLRLAEHVEKLRCVVESVVFGDSVLDIENEEDTGTC